MDKTALRKKILTLEGLTNEEKSALLELLNKQKKYGLVWEEKPEDVEKRLRDSLPVFKEVKERAILSDSPDAPNHILIEGDNLEALTALSYTHEGKIDVIYIDPPYNTGNKDFIYNDSFVDSEDGYRHSKWLSFMSKRLRIAKRLLSDKGVIFISIDDNEQAQLKLLCDEEFGYMNFFGMITRATGTTTGQDTGSLGKACDYVLIFSKKNNYIIGGIPLSEKDIERYSLSDEKGNFSILQLRRTGGEDRREDRPTMFFPITAPDGTSVYPYGPTGYESRWRVGPSKVKQMEKDNLLYFKKDKNGEWKVYYKFYCENKTKRPSNLWIEIDGNKKAQIELKSILGDKKFETPKPIDLIYKILQITNSSRSIILDFFAGSGTTLHATMQLNSEDGGHRQCILVTNNENKICEEVTYERNKRV
ncbi:MAG: site-specific DNA-methyltransferase, partial [Lachnospiraceae bacterium]